MADDPFALFDAWFAEAQASEPNDPNAMALATADADGRPSVRMVLLKGHGPRRLRVLHQPREPQGGRARRQSAGRAAVPLEVAAPAGADRGRGDASRPTPSPTPISPSRSRDSQLGAWASDQSRPLDARATFEARVRGDAGAVRRAATCRARRTGAAIASRPSGSSSGRTARTACTSAACSRAAGDGWTEGLLYP